MPRLPRLPRLSIALPPKPFHQTRPFTLLNPSTRTHQNRIFDPIRQPTDLHTLLLLTASSNTPLITLWHASFSPSSLFPLLLRLIRDERVGEREGGLGFAEVHVDSALIGDLVTTYRVSGTPMLLAFARQEAQFERVVRGGERMGEEEVRVWLVGEARRGGRMGGGGGGMFGVGG